MAEDVVADLDVGVVIGTGGLRDGVFDGARGFLGFHFCGWDGLEVDMMLEDDTFTLGPDEEEDFTATFSGQTRLSAELSYDFTLTATVTNVGMLDWPEALASNASVSGDLNIARAPVPWPKVTR